MSSLSVRSLRDSLNGTVRLTALEQALVDSAPFQRLREVKQLNLAYVAYEGATHTRFEHAIGVNHNGKLAVDRLRQRDPRMAAAVSDTDETVFLVACLLHDLSHSGIGSHLVEEMELDGADHELGAERLIRTGEIAAILSAHGLGPVAQDRIARLIRKAHWDHPLQPLLSSSFDMDKLDYMRRDSQHCGVPYGMVDRDRLLDSLVLVTDPSTGGLTVGLSESGLISLEHLLMGRRLLYASVYWHRAVRAASSMRQALVTEALTEQLLSVDELGTWTDEDVRVRLGDRITQGGGAVVRDLHQRLLDRRLYKEVDTVSGPVLTGLTSRRLATASAVICQQLGLARGAVLLDLPVKPGLMAPDGLCATKDGTVLQFTALGDRFPFAAMAPMLEAATFTLRVFARPDLVSRRTAITDHARAVLDALDDGRPRVG